MKTNDPGGVVTQTVPLPLCSARGKGTATKVKQKRKYELEENVFLSYSPVLFAPLSIQNSAWCLTSTSFLF